MTHPSDHLTHENSRCRKGNRCIYGFPKPITSETCIDKDSRVHFRRRSIEDIWIVAHIPELIEALDCHIFVDIAFTVAVFMYLYKYMFKGPDRSYFHIAHRTGDDPPEQSHISSVNEIKDYVDGRYLSSPEAAWRILGFHLTNKNPSVRSLTIHLPGENVPQFLKEESASSLIRYFHRPIGHLFDQLSYIQYNQQFIAYSYDDHDILADDEFLETPISHTPLRKIRKRRRGRPSVARIQTISPSAGELFYLRCLLMHRHACSFKELRTFENVTFASFHEAAIHLGLFSTVHEGFYAMEEAVASYIPPSQLRFLFARILLEGFPALPLWDTFKDCMALDFVHSLHSTEHGIDRTLQQIQEFIQDGGRRLQDYGLPAPLLRSPEVVNEVEAFHGRHLLLTSNASNALSTMNLEQRQLYFNILSNITGMPPVHQPSSPIFIEGRPGRGKTFVVNAIVNNIRGEGKIVLIVGTSALAASLYERGRTAHNLFDIPVTDVRPLLLASSSSLTSQPSFAVQH